MPRLALVPRLLPLGAVVWLAAPPLASQSLDSCQGPERSDTPIDVALDDLASAAAYKGRAVRTKGRLELEIDAQTRARRYRLGDRLHAVRLVPCPGIADELDEMALRGLRVEVTGVFSEVPAAVPEDPRAPSGLIQFWSVADISALEQPSGRAPAMRLGQLSPLPPSPGGGTVRVLGQFGGLNLLGDLPAGSQPEASAWVLRDGRQSLWVLGKRPEGSGWRLDPTYLPDTARWLEVEGRLERCGSSWCLRARKVALTSRPSS